MYTTCVCPPALSSILVVARVAELGKQVKKEDTVLETPWANSSWNKTQVQRKQSTDWWESNTPTSSCDILTLYLVGMYGISMLIGVDHCQWDRHGVANKCDGYCVSSDVRESVQSRHPGPRESRDRGVKSQTTGSYFSIIRFVCYFQILKITQLGCGQLSQCCKQSPARRHRPLL